MIPLHHSNRQGTNVLPRKSNRPPIVDKSFPYNGSASCYNNNNVQASYYERPPPPRRTSIERYPQRPTILSLQYQPCQAQQDGPFLIPPPPTSATFYGTRQRQPWDVTSDRSRFNENISIRNHAREQVNQPTNQFPHSSTVTFYCERKKPKSKRSFVLKTIFFIAMLTSWGYAAHKYGFFGIKSGIDFSFSDVYHSLIDNEWLANFTGDKFHEGISFLKEQVQSISKMQNAAASLESTIGSVKQIKSVLFSMDDDLEATVEIVDV